MLCFAGRVYVRIRKGWFHLELFVTMCCYYIGYIFFRALPSHIRLAASFLSCLLGARRLTLASQIVRDMWQHDPKARPSARRVVQRLEILQKHLALEAG